MAAYSRAFNFVEVNSTFNQAAAKLETTYGYSDYGETIKRSLYKGDMEGVTKLYGSY